MTKKEYLERVELTIQRMHDCEAILVDSVPVQETVNGRVIWQGTVEIFKLIGHPKAKRCFAWPRPEGEVQGGQPFYVVLDIPPISSPESAVRATLGNAAKGGVGPVRQPPSRFQPPMNAD